jgi:putative restriction endonuclease
MYQKENDLQKYINQLTNLKRDHKFGGAPHKPILLLSIIDCIKNKLITSNKIYISPELVSVFKENWKSFVITPHSPIFSLPFYHCRTEPFWELIAKNGFEKIVQSKFAMKTFTHLNEAIDYALIDNVLFELLKDNESGNILKISIIQKYFPHIKFYGNNENDIVKKIENLIFDDKIEIQEFKKENEEEEFFARGGLFKKLVPKAYEFRCCISGMKLISLHDISMIDACHIKPISFKGIDHITNGIALNPNLHRAYDRGLISIDTNLKVVVSKYFDEDESNEYSLRKFEGKPIKLPFGKNFYPNLDFLKWHNENIFKY